MKKNFLIFLIVLFVFIPVRAKDEKYTIVSGDINTVGSEICFNTECFYIISNDGKMVNLLSKYNLLVGNKYNLSDDIVTPLEKPSGIQDITAKGYFRGNSATNPLIGTVPFSNGVYWNLEEHPGYIYDNNSNLYVYVENYKKYLNDMGVSVKKARLISYEELVTLGCNLEKNECSGAPAWVYSTTYWTGSSGDGQMIWNVISNSYAYADLYNCNRRGVRPVIEIPVGWFSSSDNVYIGNVIGDNSNNVVSYNDNVLEIDYSNLVEESTYSVVIYNDSSDAMYVKSLNVENESNNVVECRLTDESINLKIEAYSYGQIDFYVKPLTINDSLEDNIKPLKVTFNISNNVYNPDTFYKGFEFVILISVFIFCILMINKIQKIKLKKR